VIGGRGWEAKPKKNYSQKKIRKKKSSQAVKKKYIPSLEDRPINFTKKNQFQPSSEKKYIFLL
jgi:hypothetical protein